MNRSSMLIALGAAAVASAAATTVRAAERLPENLIGQYASRSEHLSKVIPVELSNIKVTGQKVTGVVSRYTNGNGTCAANSTPFTGTYKDGVLSIKSRTITSRRNGVNCGRIVLNAKVSGGRVVGTFGLGADNGTPIELAAK